MGTLGIKKAKKEIKKIKIRFFYIPWATPRTWASIYCFNVKINITDENTNYWWRGWLLWIRIQRSWSIELVRSVLQLEMWIQWGRGCRATKSPANWLLVSPDSTNDLANQNRLRASRYVSKPPQPCLHLQHSNFWLTHSSRLGAVAWGTEMILIG